VTVKVSCGRPRDLDSYFVQADRQP
jgi:hypothetical protein